MIDRPTNLEPAVGRLLVKPNHADVSFAVWKIEEVRSGSKQTTLLVGRNLQ